MAHSSRHPVELSDAELLAECLVQRVRRSGPGGQHRNKVETGVVLQHQPTAVRAEASERRSQSANQSMALFRLRLQLALSVRRPLAEKRPSTLWEQRCRNGRISVNPQHGDFPILLAELMDELHEADYDLHAVSDRMHCSRSQLTRFLKLERRAFQLLNSERTERGMRRLQ